MIDRHPGRSVPVARELRDRETLPEDLLWQALRNRRLDGFKFRRQHPVGRFVADFCCLEPRLVVEVDGEIHDRQQARDAERDAILVATGFRVLRIPNADVQTDFRRVLVTIRGALRATTPALPEDTFHSPQS